MSSATDKFADLRRRMNMKREKKTSAPPAPAPAVEPTPAPTAPSTEPISPRKSVPSSDDGDGGWVPSQRKTNRHARNKSLDKFELAKLNLEKMREEKKSGASDIISPRTSDSGGAPASIKTGSKSARLSCPPGTFNQLHKGDKSSEATEVPRDIVSGRMSEEESDGGWKPAPRKEHPATLKRHSRQKSVDKFELAKLNLASMREKKKGGVSGADSPISPRSATPTTDSSEGVVKLNESGPRRPKSRSFKASDMRIDTSATAKNSDASPADDESGSFTVTKKAQTARETRDMRRKSGALEDLQNLQQKMGQMRTDANKTGRRGSRPAPPDHFIAREGMSASTSNSTTTAASPSPSSESSPTPSAPTGELAPKVDELSSGQRMAMASKKLLEMKNRTSERRRRAEERKKRKQQQKANVTSQIDTFITFMRKVEPMMKKLETEKQELEVKLKALESENSTLKRKLAAATDGQSSHVEAKKKAVVIKEKYNVSGGNDKEDGMAVEEVSAEERVKLIRERRESVAAITETGGGAPPPPPPPPAAPLLPPPSSVSSGSAIKLKSVAASDASSGGGSGFLDQLMQTKLKKLDPKQVEEERKAQKEEGSLFQSLQDTMKMALEIRRNVMETQDSDEEDDFSDDDDWMDEEAGEIQQLLKT